MMHDSVFSLNGTIVPQHEAVVSITDRGFLYGDGLFETLHAYGRRLFRAHEHLDRLEHGAERLFFDPLPERRSIARWLKQAVEAAAFPEAVVRLTVTRGSGPAGRRGPSIPQRGSSKYTVAIMVMRFARAQHGPVPKGGSAVIASFRRQESAVAASLKTLNYIEQILARREADAAGVDEAILLNNAGLLCEGSSSNIALVRNGSILVPDPARSGALPGIAQMTAVEAARKQRLPVSYTFLSPWDLSGADEAFLSGSMREITPLVRVGGKRIGSGKPGPVTVRLIAEYRRIVERECAPFKYARQSCKTRVRP